MDLEQPLYFEGQANSLSSPAPRSLLPNVRDYSRYTKWRACWQTRNAKISIIVRDSWFVIIMALSIPSPKDICQLLTPTLTFDICAEANKLKNSRLKPNRQFQLLLRDLLPIIGINRSVSR